MRLTRIWLLPLTTLPLLTACASNPTPDHRFYTETGEQGMTFTLVHFNEADETPGVQRAPNGERPAKGQRGGGQRAGKSRGERPADSAPSASTPPQQDSVLLALLEQELDQRQLCPEGYHITQWRPTERGVLIQGQCQ